MRIIAIPSKELFPLKYFRNKRFLILFAIAALLIGWLWWGNNALSVEEYTFSSPRLPQGWDGARMVHLSDLHGKEFGRGSARLLRAVAEAEPELIVITGDIADAKSGLATLPPLLQGLADIAPTYYVSGNHEWGAGFIGQLRELLDDAGVTYLRNEFVPLSRGNDTIVLAGIEDPNGYADQKTPQEVAAELHSAEGDPFWLLLAHRNNRFCGEYCLLQADLTLCGHGHGGIWRLPFTDGLISTTMEWFPSYTNGFYACDCGQCGGAQVFVHRGLGNSPRIPRLLNRPEVAVITLQTSP